MCAKMRTIFAGRSNMPKERSRFFHRKASCPAETRGSDCVCIVVLFTFNLGIPPYGITRWWRDALRDREKGVDVSHDCFNVSPRTGVEQKSRKVFDFLAAAWTNSSQLVSKTIYQKYMKTYSSNISFLNFYQTFWGSYNSTSDKVQIEQELSTWLFLFSCKLYLIKTLICDLVMKILKIFSYKDICCKYNLN